MKTALLIIDIQNDYFEQGAMELAAPEQASENAKKMLKKYRSANLEIIHIQHIAIQLGATFFIPNTKGAEIHDSVKPIKNEKLIVKHYPNSFRESQLLSYLKNQHITDLTICGMMTHMCIDATTRAAYDYGFNCIVIGDACATKDLNLNGEVVKAKDVHAAFLAALEGTYAAIKTTAEFTNSEKTPSRYN